MAQNIITIEQFSKSFGNKQVVSDVSFDVKKGEFFAFLGTNGAGKTTTIRTLLGIYTPDNGKLLINGEKYSHQHAGLVGYLPEERGIFLNSQVLETLIYFGQLKNMSFWEAKKWALEYLERIELADKKNLPIKKLSSGQQQKIQFGITLIGDPQLLILDEPTKGFDPLNRQLLFDMLLERKAKGATIMFSTHHMEEAEKYANRILILKQGKVALYGSLESIKKEFSESTLQITFEGILHEHKQLFKITKLQTYNGEINQASLLLKKPTNEVLTHLAGQKLKIIRFEANQASLDEIFIQVAKQESKHQEKASPSPSSLKHTQKIST